VHIFFFLLVALFLLVCCAILLLKLSMVHFTLLARIENFLDLDFGVVLKIDLDIESTSFLPARFQHFLPININCGVSI
jgi:hypothetical protein